MLALVRAQVDVPRRACSYIASIAAFSGRGVAGEREDRTVVRRVGRIVEQAHARHRADGGGDRLDDLGPAPFADVGNALDDWHADY